MRSPNSLITSLFALSFACAVPARSVHAQVATSPAAPSWVGELMAILLPLVVIIAGLLVVLRLARRRYGLTGVDAPLSVVQVLAVGPRERIVVVRTRSGGAFVVGVAGQAVNLVTRLDPEDVAPASVQGPDGDGVDAGGTRTGILGLGRVKSALRRS